MTSIIRPCLGDWIQRYNVTSLTDFSCGDANWQGQIPGIDSIEYSGYDIADMAIEHARQHNKGRDNMSFGVLDLTRDAPPGRPDMVLMRDVIQHLSLQHGRDMLRVAKKTGARYLAVTTFHRSALNMDMGDGGFYHNNVHGPPFVLPPSLERCDNYRKDWYRSSSLELIDLAEWNDTWVEHATTSGGGSTVANSSTVRPCLSEWIRTYNVTSLVEYTCGDAVWQGLIPGIDHITYQGYDKDDMTIELARSYNKDHVNMSFDVLDLVSTVPPKKPDMILMRDVIQHLSFENATRMLVNAKQTGARYLAVTTFTRPGSNSDIPDGEFYHNDIYSPPYLLPTSVEKCDNYPGRWYRSSHLDLIDLAEWNETRSLDYMKMLAGALH